MKKPFSGMCGGTLMTIEVIPWKNLIHFRLMIEHSEGGGVSTLDFRIEPASVVKQ